MKNLMNIKLLSLLLLMMGVLVSCSDSDDNGDTSPKVANLVLPDKPHDITLLAPKDTSLLIQIELDKVSDQNVLLDIEVDRSLVETYNAANGTSYESLPVDCYEFPITELIIPRYNLSSSRATLKLATLSLPDAKRYVLPIRITAIRGDNSIAIDDTKVMYVVFGKEDLPELQFFELQDLELTTEVGVGKKNWFAAYAEGHLFDVASAASISDRMDFALIEYNNNAYFYSSIIGSKSAAYKPRIERYLTGFDKLTYLLISGQFVGQKHAPKKEHYDKIKSYDDLEKQIDEYEASGYAYRTKADRVLSDILAKDQVVVLAWGPGYRDNRAFAFVWIKDVQQNADGKNYTVKFNVKYFEDDFRTKYPEGTINKY